jgi:hypothetical protein
MALWFSARPRQKTYNQTHQDEDSQEFIRSLQQMKNYINKIRVNYMVQMDIRRFFNRS